MTDVLIRLLIVNKNIRFAISLKQALEQYGGFEVAPFTTADSALEFLRLNPQDIALVDFTLKEMQGAEVVFRMRALQPSLPVIATPDVPEVVAQVQDLRLNGVVDAPISLRDLLPVLQKALRRSTEALPETSEAPPLETDSDTQRLSGMIPINPERTDRPDSVLFRVTRSGVEADGETLRLQIEPVLGDSALADRVLPPPESIGLFQQLAAQEPPMPSLEESGTVQELRASLANVVPADIASVVVSMPDADLDAEAPAEESDVPLVETIIGETLDETIPLDIPDLLNRVERQFPDRVPGVKPLPSWVKNVTRYVQEPDFLREFLPRSGDEMVDGETRDIPEMLTEMITQAMEANALYEEEAEVPVEQPPELSDETPTTFDIFISPDVPPVAPVPSRFELTASTDDLFAEFPPEDEAEEELQKFINEQVTLGTQSDNPEIAQLALNLTQVSLELTADAILLAQDNEIVAYAGTMPLEDVEGLRTELENDWQTASDEARIRFVTLRASGQDYMLYTCRTEGGYALSMIFMGTLPINVIRRQSGRLLKALSRIPEQPQPSTSLLEELAALERMEAELIEAEEELQQDTTRIEMVFNTLEARPASAPEIDAEDEPDNADDSPLDAAPAVVDEVEVEPPSIPAPPVTAPISSQKPKSLAVSKAPAVPRIAQTYLWLIRNPDEALSEAAIRAIESELRNQLTEDGWDVRTLNAYEDYVYVFAEVPGEPLAHEIMPLLKARSAQIASEVDTRLTQERLWADSYCVLTPGREMRQDEIQRFINFGRMR
ncbi:MAG: hypothetical protein OHK0046_30880 [Anaerolineae bacterium]